MKDETAFLQPAQDIEAADLPPAPAVSKPPYTPPTQVRLPLFRPGTRVSHQGQPYTVGHVILRRSELLVYLQETGNPVPAEKLYLEPTVIPLRRDGAA